MKRVFIILMACLFFFNCSEKKENLGIKNKPYIISYENKKLNKYFDSLKKTSNTIAIPLNGFYGESQLIIDKQGHFYYYQKEYFRSGCGTREMSDTLPHFIDIKPNNIIKVPQASINNFLSENILHKEENRRILIIASQNDTIKNTSFFNFINRNQLRAYQIRRTTQEEDTVLKYKIDNKYYLSSDIKWDQNRIILPFVKPKL